MKFTVLGCYSPYPSKGGGTPGYLLEAKQKKILIDCGSGVLAKLSSYIPIYELDAVFLSHYHYDHISDFFVLQYAVYTALKQGYRKSPLSVWAPQEPKSWYSKMQFQDAIRLNILNEETKVDFEEDLTFQFYSTEHSEPCYAMKITEDKDRTILYGADSGPHTDWSRMNFSPDLFVGEASYLHQDIPHNHKNEHLSARQLAQAAQSIRAQHLLLTHLDPEYDLGKIKQEAKKDFYGKISVASPGWSIEL